MSLGLLVLPCMLVGAIVGTLHLIFPAALLFLFAIPSRKPYRLCVDAVMWAWLKGAAALLEMVAGVRIHTSGDDAPRPSDRVVVIVLNHHCRLDWMFFWCVASRLRLLEGGALKVALKEGLRRVPFFGWAVQAFLYIFFRRNDREADLAVAEHLDPLLVGAVAVGVDHCVAREVADGLGLQAGQCSHPDPL